MQPPDLRTCARCTAALGDRPACAACGYRAQPETSVPVWHGIGMCVLAFFLGLAAWVSFGLTLLAYGLVYFRWIEYARGRRAPRITPWLLLVLGAASPIIACFAMIGAFGGGPR